MFIIAVGDLAIVFILTLIYGTHKNDRWIICFGWGAVFDMILELLPSIIFTMIFKEIYDDQTVGSPGFDSVEHSKAFKKNRPGALSQNTEKDEKTSNDSKPKFVVSAESPHEIDILLTPQSSFDDEVFAIEEEKEDNEKSLTHKITFKENPRNKDSKELKTAVDRKNKLDIE